MQELGELLREKSTSRMAAYRNLDFGVHSTNEEGNHEKAGSVAMRHAKLLDRQPVPVRSDVFLHGLSPFTLKSLRRAIEQGLMPSGLDFTGDDDSSVIIRFAQPRAGEARLMAGVEFHPENNEVVANSTTPSHNSSTPRNPAMRTSPEASGPRSPASFANWRRRSLATRASDNRHRPTNRRIRHEAQERLDGGGCENVVSGYLRCSQPTGSLTRQ
jgi:hypothetical protein